MVSTRIQKIILFIPFLNAVIIFAFIFNTYREGWKGKKFVLGILHGIFAGLIVTIINYLLLLLPLPNNLLNILNFAYIYLSCFAIGAALINYQETLINKM